MSAVVPAQGDTPGSEALYENADFLRRQSDPFGADFEQTLESAPVLPVRRRSRPTEDASYSSVDVAAPSPVSGRHSRASSKKSSYDEMAIHSGRPVMVVGETGAGDGADPLTAVAFGSPLHDLTSPSAARPRPAHLPVPAPRLSKLAGGLPPPPERLQVSDDGGCAMKEPRCDDGQATESPIYEELVPKPPKPSSEVCPAVPPRNKSSLNSESTPFYGRSFSSPSPSSGGGGGGGVFLLDGNDNLYSEPDAAALNRHTVTGESFLDQKLPELEKEQEDSDEDLDKLKCLEKDLGSRSLLNPKLTTIDMRKDITALYDDSVKQVEQETDFVQYMEERELSKARPSSQVSRNAYDSVAIPDGKFKIVDGEQVPIPPASTLLKDFDPVFQQLRESLKEEENESSHSSSSSASSPATSRPSSRASSRLSAASQNLNSDNPPGATASPSIPANRKRDSMLDQEEPLKATSSTSNVSQEASSSNNIYVSNAKCQPKTTSTSSSSLSASDHSVPTTNSRAAYENVWIPADTGLPRLSDSTSGRQPSSLPSASGFDGAFGTSKERSSWKSDATASTRSGRKISESDSCSSQPLGGATAATAVGSDRDSASKRSSDTGDGDKKELLPKECNLQLVQPAAALKNNILAGVQRSASTNNLASIAKKFSLGKIGRKISDQVMKPSLLKDSSALPSSPTVSRSGSMASHSPISERSGGARRRSSQLQPSTGGLLESTHHHSGPLYVYANKAKCERSGQEKWCVLANANLCYFIHKDSMAEPKERIPLQDILSLIKREEQNEEGRVMYCFDVAFLYGSKKSKLQSRTFGSMTSHTRDTWLDKLSQSLSPALESVATSSSLSLLPHHNAKQGWAHLKVMFAGEWSQSWVWLRANKLFYTLSADLGHQLAVEEVELKKTKNMTLVTDIKNLNAPESTLPVLVVDFVDRSVYLQARHFKETSHWQHVIENVAFNNASTLEEQQLTKDDIPVIVEQCVNFVFRHGCMTEGIYRHSGVKTKIDRLLGEFRHNAWAVQMTREDYSEHDVANTLKRFMRTLDEPLLTEELRTEWMTASAIQDVDKKMDSYASLLSSLPLINLRTLRRLIGHLRTVANQCDKTLMPNYNLAAIWGPTLLTVDGLAASDFARTSGEADVCRDLIDHYAHLFHVTDEEMRREEAIMKKTENFNKNPNPVKLSGDVMVFVYIDTKTSGDCVSLAVTPKMTAQELNRLVLRKSNYSARTATDTSDFLLHEVILNGEMERPIHHSERIYDVTLKWWQWSDADRQGTYLLLKRNTFLEEAWPCCKPPPPLVFGEAGYGDNVKAAKAAFKKFLFSMNNAKIMRCRELKDGTAVELNSWDIERIIWYFGCEVKRQPPSNLNITFIEKDVGVERTKDRPYFGRTLCFDDRDLFIKWIAAMLVAEHQNDIRPPVTLLNIDD